MLKEKNIIAHRGYSAKYPENTTLSVKKALAEKVSKIEIDVRLTKDNKLVVSHNSNINKNTTGHGKIKNLTLKEIKKYHIKFKNKIFNLKIPELKDIISITKNKSILLIEIRGNKKESVKIAEKTVKLLKKLKAEKSCEIISFEKAALDKVHELNKKIKLQKLFGTKIAFLKLWIGKKIEIVNFKEYNHIKTFNLNANLITKSLIKKLKFHNKKINIWGSNNLKKISRLKEMGIDDFTINDINLIFQ